MKHACTVLLALTFAVGAATSGVAQAPEGRGQGREGREGGRGRGPAAAACTTLACDIQQDWDRNRQLFIGIVNAMPDDKFNFKPTPAQESFGQRVMHVAGIDVKLLSTLGGKTPAPTLNMQATSKADILAALQQSMDYGAAVLKEFSDAQLVERVTSMPFMGPTASRVRIIYFSIAHSQDIYGQLAVYLRLNGITPPASNRP
jgi:uncharacterized damage-inducible protein DinB